jgi:hypothetical protein
MKPADRQGGPGSSYNLESASMGPLIGLWRDTWWVWLVFLVIVVGLAWLVTVYYLVFLPILPGVFLYFAYNRYDSSGNAKPDVDR